MPRQFKKNLDQKSSISCNLRHHLIRSTSSLFYLWRQVISINLVVSLRPTCHPCNHQLSTTLSSILCLCMFVDLTFLCSKSLSTNSFLCIYITSCILYTSFKLNYLLGISIKTQLLPLTEYRVFTTA